MIIVDIEIEKAIPPRRGGVVEPDIQYCEGWRDFTGMGISVVCTYDLTSGLSRAFLKNDLMELAAYLNGRATTGFNTRRFDLPLLAAHAVEVKGPHYDILEQIWLALGLDPDHFVYATHGGWSLDAVAEATLGQRKSLNGALAPIYWQRGHHGKVIDYCLRDVWLEGKLLQYILENGHVRRNGERLDIARPVWSVPGGLGV